MKSGFLGLQLSGQGVYQCNPSVYYKGQYHRVDFLPIEEFEVVPESRIGVVQLAHGLHTDPRR